MALLLNTNDVVTRSYSYNYPSPTHNREVNGVGDKTPNLFNPEDFSDLMHLDLRTGLPVRHSSRCCLVKPIKVESDRYCITFVADSSKRVMYSVLDNDNNLLRRTIGVSSGDFIDTSGGTYFYIGFYDEVFKDQISNIMLNEGSTPLPYEPYGVKIPVVSRGKNLCPPFVSGKGLNLTDGQEYESSKAICTDYFPVYFNNEFIRIGVNWLPNNVTSCCFVYDKDFNFIGRAGNNIKEQISLKPEVFVNGQGTKAYDKINYMRIFISAPSYEGNVMAHYWNIRDLPSEFQPYEPYRPPITTTQYLPTPLMADERLTPTAREVKYGKYEFTGGENIGKNVDTIVYFQINGAKSQFEGSACTHYIFRPTPGAPQGYCYWSSAFVGRIVFTDSRSIEEFKVFLKSEYDAGHPVTVWYQLANPTSEPVTTTPIGTLDGECWIDVDTEVEPVSMSATYKSSKPDNDMQSLMKLFKEV